MPAQPRSYRQFCGVARSLDVVGERWSLLIVRNLLLGPRRYGDLLSELPGLTTNLLAKRLVDLADEGIIERTVLPPPVSAPVYQLTAAGAALEPVIMALGRWGGRYMDVPKKTDTVNIAWALLSLKRRYLGAEEMVVELRLDERRFTLALTKRELDVRERPADRADLTLSSSQLIFYEGMFRRGGRSLDELEKRGLVTVEGSHKSFRRFAAAFESIPPM